MKRWYNQNLEKTVRRAVWYNSSTLKNLGLTCIVMPEARGIIAWNMLVVARLVARREAMRAVTEHLYFRGIQSGKVTRTCSLIICLKIHLRKASVYAILWLSSYRCGAYCVY